LGESTFSIATCETAKTVILEVNEWLSRVLGGREECIHVSEVDAIVEAGNRPPVEMKPAVPSDLDRKIASFIVEEIPGGATVQLGSAACRMRWERCRPNRVSGILACIRKCLLMPTWNCTVAAT